jgi:hypothetical protein
MVATFGETNGLVCHSGPSSFLALRPSYPASGQRIRNSRLLCSSLYSQNPQQVLIILGGSALVAMPMVRTTPPKEDKVDTSSVEVSMAQALVS